MLKSQERPFSFYGKALAKEEAAKQYKPPTAKDFQRPFKANPIPKSSLEVRKNDMALYYYYRHYWYRRSLLIHHYYCQLSMIQYLPARYVQAGFVFPE